MLVCLRLRRTLANIHMCSCVPSSYLEAAGPSDAAPLLFKFSLQQTIP